MKRLRGPLRVSQCVNDVEERLVQLCQQHWRPHFRPPDAVFHPIDAVEGVRRVCNDVVDAYIALEADAPVNEPCYSIQQIPKNCTSQQAKQYGQHSMALRRLYDSIVNHRRVHQVQLRRLQELKGQQTVYEMVTAGTLDHHQELELWTKVKEDDDPQLQPSFTMELDLAHRAFNAHHSACDMVIHNGYSTRTRWCMPVPDWGMDPTSAKFREAQYEIERSYHVTSFSHASQSIIRSMERFRQFKLIRILPLHAEIGLVLEKEGAGTSQEKNENQLIRNAFSHNNYWCAPAPPQHKLMGEYRVYLWNSVGEKKKKDKRKSNDHSNNEEKNEEQKQVTYASFTSFPDLMNYELRLRVILTLLVTGVLYSQSDIEKMENSKLEDDEEEEKELTEEEKDTERVKKEEEKKHKETEDEEKRKERENRRRTEEETDFGNIGVFGD